MPLPMQLLGLTMQFLQKPKISPLESRRQMENTRAQITAILSRNQGIVDGRDQWTTARASPASARDVIER